MGFIVLLFLSALSIAGSAAFFSVYGLARVFSGSFWPVVIMASSLEGGKLISASFLYRYWKTITLPMKSYLFGAILVLMLITSMGIFGYLSSAFQDNVLPYQVQNQQIVLLEGEKAESEKLKAERLSRQEQINKQIANLPDTSINGRRRLMAANKDELTQINSDIAQYTNDIREHTQKISQLKGQTVQETAHVGPIIFIAQAFGLGINEATKWLIFLIIVAFDPLAVILTVGLNMALNDYKKKTKEEPMKTVNIEGDKIAPVVEEDYGLPEPSYTPPMPPVSPPKPERIVAHDGWYSEDGGMSFKHPAPHAAAPTAMPFTTFKMGQISNDGTAVAGLAYPFYPQPPAVVLPPQDAAVLDYFNRTDLTPQEETMRENIKKTIQNYTEVAEHLRTNGKQS